MTTPTHITAQDLATLKEFWTAEDARNGGISDTTRCITEIERLSAENDKIRNEASRIILLAEDQPSLDGNTYCVRFTKELLDELRSLITSPSQQ